MAKVIIISDSTCDLNNLIKERDVVVLPLKVCFGENMYKDQVELSTIEMFKKVEETNTLPKTAADKSEPPRPKVVVCPNSSLPIKPCVTIIS